MKLIHIFHGGPTRRIKDADGKVWSFEMHPYCGPAATNQRGDPMGTQPGPRSPFWAAVTQWAQQGGVVDASGLCQWTPEPQPELVHLGGRNFAAAGSALAEKHGRPKAPEQKHTRTKP